MRKNIHRYVKTVFALLLFAGPLSAQTVTHAFPQETIESRVKELTNLFRKNIAFDSKEIGNTVIPKLTCQDNTLDQILDQSLKTTVFTYKKVSGTSYILTKRAANAKSTGTGKLSGRVSDEKGEPISGSTIKILGTKKATISDANGNYFLQAPAGSNTLEVSFMSYRKQILTGVQVEADKTTKLDVTLQENEEELSEVTVTGQVRRSSAAGLMLLQKSAISMTDGISADQIKKTSDNNVAQVLKRVSGVTIQEGKYVTVRGMSERYNNVQLNGSSLPSTEPNRRNFSFDIIPSSLVEDVTVSKTFTPDLPAEFTGGLVQVNTLSVPDSKFLHVGVGTGGNTNSTGNDFYSSKRYTADYFLGETDKRTWYAGDNQQSITNAIQKNTWGLYRYTAMPMQNYSFSAGLPIDLGGNNKLGIVTGLTYRHEDNIETTTESTLRGGDSLTSPAHKYKFATSIGAVVNVGWQRPGHKITWNNLYNNRVTNTSLIRDTQDDNMAKPKVDNYSVILIGNLVQTQLKGEHKLLSDKLKLTWNADYNKSTRTNPDDRHVVGIYYEEPFINWSYGTNDNIFTINNGHLMYSKLEESKKNIGANLEYSFKLNNNSQKLKAGYLGSFREASYRQLYLRGNRIGSNELLGLSLHDYYAPQYFAEGIQSYFLSGTTQGGGNFYNGNQDVHAAYLMGDFSFFNKLHLIGGVRMENEHTYAVSEDSVTVDKVNWLPSVTAVYNLTDKINIRAAYSQTLARPDFRELSTCSYYNVEDRMTCFVAKALDQTETRNYDFRFEWYPQAGELVSFSLFYKQFSNPVENIAYLMQDGQNYMLKTVNLDKFDLKGAEFSFRKSFGFIAPALKDVFLSGNAVYQKGDIRYSEWEVSRVRPLQGLSPYSINGGLTYQGARVGASVNYSRVGRKLMLGGEYAKTDEYENPRDVIDIQLSALFLNKKLEVKANISDLLAQDVITYRNCAYKNYTIEDRTDLGLDYNPSDWLLNRIKKGSSYSLSISYKF
jgi:TonB-dependent receptor